MYGDLLPRSLSIWYCSVPTVLYPAKAIFIRSYRSMPMNFSVKSYASEADNYIPTQSCQQKPCRNTFSLCKIRQNGFVFSKEFKKEKILFCSEQLKSAPQRTSMDIVLLLLFIVISYMFILRLQFLKGHGA